MADFYTIDDLGSIPGSLSLVANYIFEVEERNVNGYELTGAQLRQFVTAINELSTIGAVDATNDFLLIWDTSVGATANVAPENLLTAIVVDDGTTTVSPAKQVTFSPLLAVTNPSAGVAGVDLKINVLTTNPAIQGTDLVVIEDVSTGGNSKATINELATALGGSSKPFTTNTETLAGTKTLLSTDANYQTLDPDGSDRDVVLPDPPENNDFFVIANNSDGTSALNIKETAAGAVIVILGTSSGDALAECIYDGTNWRIELRGSF